MIRKNKLGIFIICTILLIYASYYFYDYLVKTKEKELINNYFEKVEKKEDYNYQNVDDEYIGILEIPKLNLQKGFLNITDKNNNINKNIQVLPESTMPNQDNHLLIIAAHSGSSSKAYFTDLNKLEINDEVYVYYEKAKYSYQVYDIQNILKDGTLEIYENYEATLVLTTCNEQDKTKQIVVYAKLISKTI